MAGKLVRTASSWSATLLTHLHNQTLTLDNGEDISPKAMHVTKNSTS